MQHPDEGTIHSWLDGALSADEAARIEAHVAECPQCSAAVAEARGFIAASSRILTALDDVPRGVVPVARPARWSNPAVWRAAAAVLVVATGSLVVVRNIGKDSRAEYTFAETPASAPVPKPAVPMTILANPGRGASGNAVQKNSGPAQKSLEKRLATDAAAVPERTLATTGSRVTDSGNAGTLSSRPNIVADQTNALKGQVGAISEKTSTAAGGYARVAPAPGVMLRGMSSLAAEDASSSALPLKVVGTRRQLGAKVTLYEVAPNDTVTLTELMNLQLESQVVTGMSTTRERVEGRAAGKSAVAAPPQRADAAVASPQASQRGAAAAAPAFTPTVPAPVAAIETTNGVTTLTWTDATTGNSMRLSGRIPVPQLIQTKTRIERERAAAAAAARKNP